MNSAASTPEALQHPGNSSGRERVTDVRTIVFTDMVGSTRLKQVLGDVEGSALIEQHHELLRSILASFPDGSEITNSGDGFLLLFSRPSNAVAFALRLQKELRAYNAEATMKVEDRVSVHAGEVIMQREANGSMMLLGIQVDTASRINSLAAGDQILLTRFVFDNARQMLRPSDISGLDQLSWISHGHYEVDGVEEPLEVCEVGEEKAAKLTAPTESAKARRRTQSDGSLVLGWRPSAGENVAGTGWRLERKLGEGGFGEVWLARHVNLHQARVFKFCFFADRARSLRREATLFRVLAEQVRDHPNIVRIDDVYLERPPYYLSMEYVEGEDLIKWVESVGGPEQLTEECKLGIVAQIADGLAAAHAAGVLHRDVKPSNILIGTTGKGHIQPKLTDFGIGQVVSQEILAGMTGLGFTRTIIGSEKDSASGTRLYMAPELLAGMGASPQSDIYSLGVVLYQLLIDDFHRPVTTDWSRRLSDPLLQEDLVRCFAGDPAERFTSASEFAASLRALAARRREKVDAEAEAARREKAAYRRGVYRAAAVAGVILSIVLAVAASALSFARKARENNRRNEAILDFMLQDLRAKLEPSGRREVLLSVVERVLENQRELNASGNGNAEGLLREASALILHGDIQVYRGFPKQAREDYDGARRVLGKVLQSNPDSLPARRLRGSLGYKLSDVAFLLGEQPEAQALAEQGRVELTQLLESAVRNGAASRNPAGTISQNTVEFARLQRDTGIAVSKAAGYRTGNEQEELYRESLRLCENAISAAPDQLQWRFEVAELWCAVGRSARTRGSADEALAALRKSDEFASELLSNGPGNATWRHLTAKIAIQKALLAQQREAVAGSLDTAISILEQVHTADPGNVWCQQDLADAHDLYAEHLDAAGKSSEAELHRSTALALQQELPKRHPDVVIWKLGDSQHLAASVVAEHRPPETPTATVEVRSLPVIDAPPEKVPKEKEDWAQQAKLANDAVTQARSSLQEDDLQTAEEALKKVPPGFTNLSEVVVVREQIVKRRQALTTRSAGPTPPSEQRPNAVSTPRPAVVQRPKPPPVNRPPVRDSPFRLPSGGAPGG